MSQSKKLGYYLIFVGIFILANALPEACYLFAVQHSLWLDFTGLLFLAAGWGVLRDRNGYRIFAIVLCALGVAGTVLGEAIALWQGTDTQPVVVLGYHMGVSRAVVAGYGAASVAFFGTPLLGLLSPSTVSEFVLRRGLAVRPKSTGHRRVGLRVATGIVAAGAALAVCLLAVGRPKSNMRRLVESLCQPELHRLRELAGDPEKLRKDSGQFDPENVRAFFAPAVLVAEVESSPNTTHEIYRREGFDSRTCITFSIYPGPGASLAFPTYFRLHDGGWLKAVTYRGTVLNSEGSQTGYVLALDSKEFEEYARSESGSVR